MAHILEEEFVTQNLQEGSIFEFGCGDCAWAKTIAPRKVYTVDLYQPAVVPDNVQFQLGNVLDQVPAHQFSNVVTLSAFEHAGIETHHFSTHTVDTDELYRVAEALVSMMTSGGKLLLTVPGGKNEVYGVKNGKATPFELFEDYEWGYRTFTLDRVCRLFHSLNVKAATAYSRISKDLDYFDRTSWIEISPEGLTNTYEEQNVLLCIVLEKP